MRLCRIERDLDMLACTLVIVCEELDPRDLRREPSDVDVVLLVGERVECRPKGCERIVRFLAGSAR